MKKRQWALYKAKGVGFIAWNGRHYAYHIFIGLLWAWFLREVWNEFNWRWIWLSIFGSLLPDIDHFIYHLGAGKEDSYTKKIMKHLKQRKWRELTIFLKEGHKHQTNLSYHNIYTIGALFGVSVLSSRLEWETGVILFGAMLLHMLFDILDDILVLGYVNPNWRRWGNGKEKNGPRHFF